ncbi:MAG: DUF2782 domain-containing protein [Xanthomonadales bacterium]|nr:DUF2782 domain-containing protein [Xanthomonadales bacterium]
MRAAPLLLLPLLAPGLATAEPAREEAPLPEKVPPPDEPPPTVRIRRVREDLVIEYRRGGRLWMVRVEPRHGPPYHLIDTNGDGRLDRADSDLPIRPVYYTIYAWD